MNAGTNERIEQREELRVDAVDEPRKGDCVSNMLELADPGDCSLNAHTETRVGQGAVPSEVEIPIVLLCTQSLLAHSSE